ncbi:F-box domain containing protein [Quillaja saponaria]|uniref:F-box domain containing protein n=1 Tax=Quillaja saponaria TaxID=32244 RepID=A0AAD7L608_QUISA|nr:F-box domain containing protein [Quillaja saponaria]
MLTIPLPMVGICSPSTSYLTRFDPVRPVAPIGCLILLRLTNCTLLRLVICNPFTRQFRHLPVLNISRTNPAVGMEIVDSNQNVQFPCFRVYVAGGMSEAACGGAATYEPTLEMYDSQHDTWKVVGLMPMEFAVRLTVWTPNESVYSKGVLYWVTSARAYIIIGFDILSNTWRELNVPMADQLEFATLVRLNGELALIGGISGGNACIWELREGDVWCLIEKVSTELGLRFLGGKRNWGRTKCVGNDGAICLYRELGSGMVVWREHIGGEDKREWYRVDGCFSIKGKQVHTLQIRGILIQPTLASYIFQ